MGRSGWLTEYAYSIASSIGWYRTSKLFIQINIIQWPDLQALIILLERLYEKYESCSIIVIELKWFIWVI